MSDEWAIHVTEEYDYRISCARKAEATECIVSARFDATGDTVRVTLSSQLDLKGIVATRLAPKRPITGEGSAPSSPVIDTAVGAASSSTSSRHCWTQISCTAAFPVYSCGRARPY